MDQNRLELFLKGIQPTRKSEIWFTESTNHGYYIVGARRYGPVNGGLRSWIDRENENHFAEREKTVIEAYGSPLAVRQIHETPHTVKYC